MDWLTKDGERLTIQGQVAFELLKILTAFITVLIVTRWTLARADRKDAVARQSAALMKLSEARISALNRAMAGLGKLRLNLSDLKHALENMPDDDTVTKAVESSADYPHNFDELLLNCETLIEKAGKGLDEEVGNVLLALEEYGPMPKAVKCDWLDPAEAFIFWSTDARTSLAENTQTAEWCQTAYEKFSDIQAQLRILTFYEVSVQLDAALSPRYMWDPAIAAEVERTSLPFLLQPVELASNEERSQVEASRAQIPEQQKKDRTARVEITQKERQS